MFLLSFVLAISWTYAQNVTGKKEAISNPVTATTDRDPKDFPRFTSTETAEALIKDILDVLGLESNFKVKEAKVANAEADIRHHERYILYNPDFINQVNKATNSKWPSIFILAHEIGHHLDGHTVLGKNSSPAIELEADEFAGFVLYKLGASLQEAQLAMFIIAKKETSKTHPGREDRLNAIEKGWKKSESLN